MGCVGCERGRCCTPGGLPARQAPGERLEMGHPGNGPAYPRIAPVSVQCLAPRGAAWLGCGVVVGKLCEAGWGLGVWDGPSTQPRQEEGWISAGTAGL